MKDAHDLQTHIEQVRLEEGVSTLDRVSKLKYESMRIGSNVVFFSRADLGKKETITNGAVYSVTFRDRRKLFDVPIKQNWARDQNFRKTPQVESRFCLDGELPKTVLASYLRLVFPVALFDEV